MESREGGPEGEEGEGPEEPLGCPQHSVGPAEAPTASARCWEGWMGRRGSHRPSL